MQHASNAAWSRLAQEGFPEHLTDPQLDTRLAQERIAARSREVSLEQRLSRIAHERPTNAAAEIVEVLTALNLSFKDSRVEHAMAETFAVYPNAVAEALIKCITGNLSLPFRVTRYLAAAPLVDDGPLAAAVLDPSTEENRLIAAAAVAGPVTVRALFDQLLAVADQMAASNRRDEHLRTQFGRLEGALHATRQAVFIPELLSHADTPDPNRIALLADLFSRQGRDANEKPLITEAFRAASRTMIESWMTVLLAASGPVRHASSEVAMATERLADPALAEPLRRLLERDLTDHAAARQGYLSRPRTGHMPSDAIMSYSNLYARAFAAMRGDQAIAILKRDLTDLRWGIDAAHALFAIWSAENPQKQDRAFAGWSNFSLHLSRRAERISGTPPTSEFAEEIFSAVRLLGAAGRSSQEQGHAIQLAVTALGLPHGFKRAEIDALLALPVTFAQKQTLLISAARAGEVLPAVELIGGVKELLVAAQNERWRLDDSRGELMGWIDLFPFSDNPEQVVDAIAWLPEQYQRPRALTRLLEALPQSPAATAVAVFQRLAEFNPDFLKQADWLRGLLRIDAEEAARFVLDRLVAGLILVGDGLALSRALVSWANKNPSVRVLITERYPSLEGSVRAVVETALEQLTGEDAFWALFEGQASASYPFQRLARPIRNLAVGRTPSEAWSGAFEEFSVPLTDLRARLFVMVRGNDAKARLAERCLIAIEEYRDELGRLTNEPRHPDISSGRPWPPAAEEW